jgi:hypothetical protein
MRHPRAHVQAAKTLLAVGIVVAVVVALPRVDDAGTGTEAAPAGGFVAVHPSDDLGRLLEERGALAVAVGEEEAISPELADPPFESPLPPEEIERAMEVATRFAVEYATYHYDETPDERLARLTPLVTDELARLLATGSTALAEREARLDRQEVRTATVAHAQPIAATSTQLIVVVGIHITISTRSDTRLAERTYRLTLDVEPNNGWLVAHLEP